MVHYGLHHTVMEQAKHSFSSKLVMMNVSSILLKISKWRQYLLERYSKNVQVNSALPMYIIRSRTKMADFHCMVRSTKRQFGLQMMLDGLMLLRQPAQTQRIIQNI